MMTGHPAVAVYPRQCLLRPGQASVTLHVADPQLEYLGRRTFIDNSLLDYFVPSSNRNTVSMATAPLYVDTLLDHARRILCCDNVTMQILGDIPDTPCASEMADFEAILARHPIPVEGYDRGNHSSSNAFGVINLLSHFYRGLRAFFGQKIGLEDEICEACGGEDKVLTPRRTFEGMYRILHRTRGGNGIEGLNVRVEKADNCKPTFATFWRPVASPDADGQERVSYWECLVNYDQADLPADKRKGKVTPFYIQATEEVRFQLEDGVEVPVYTISLDTLDSRNFISVLPGVSELQIRLVEIFIEEKLKENPNARFKLSAHFPAERLNNWTTPCAVKKAFKRLLAREEVILFVCGHSHKRDVQDLTQKMGLKRKTPLMEIVIPSLVDYSPAQRGDSKAYQDARALGIERMRVERGADGRPVIKIDVEFKGLDPEDFSKEMTPEVRQALADYKARHGYMRARETFRDLQKKLLKGFLVRQWRRVKEFFTVAVNPRHEKKFMEYWREESVFQRVFDNLTAISVAQMFNEAEHLIPLLRSLVTFMRADEGAGESAAVAQVEGVLRCLEAEYPARSTNFDTAVARGDRASELRRYNDLFVRTGVDRLSGALISLKAGGQARTFAALAGLEASREEYQFHRGRPTRIPNKVPTISVAV